MKIHRLSERFSRAWLNNPKARANLVPRIYSLYPGEEIVVVDMGGRTIGQISPQGMYKVVPKPRPTVALSMTSNKPDPSVCPCRTFYHQEGKPPTYEWQSLGKNEHHPVCQYNKGAQTDIIKAAADAGMRVAQKVEEAEGKAGGGT